jgi:hypothetical protein
MFNKFKNSLNSFGGNLGYYSPGLFLILIALLIVVAPMLLVFFVSSVIFMVGFSYIAMVRRSLKYQQSEVRNFRQHFRDQASHWYYG